MSNIIYPTQLEYLTQNRKEENSFILELETFAKENKVPILNWNAAELLEQLVKIKSPKKVLEIGTAIGYSTIRIARNLKGDSSIKTIELSSENITIAKSNFIKSGIKKRIKQLEGNAMQILPTLKSNYDFIFLDADKKYYIKLFKLSLKILKQEGIIFVDNLLWQGYTASKTVPEKFLNSTNQIRKFNKIFLSEPMLETTILPIGDGIGLGIKK